MIVGWAWQFLGWDRFGDGSKFSESGRFSAFKKTFAEWKIPPTFGVTALRPQ
jgi:hypothetical protein